MLKAIAQEQVTTKQRDGRLNVNRGDSYRNRFADKLAVSNFVFGGGILFFKNCEKLRKIIVN